MRKKSPRFWIALGSAILGFALFGLTLVTREWIEFFFGVEPDGGNGSLEFLSAAVFLIIALSACIWVRLEWRTSRAPAER